MRLKIARWSAAPLVLLLVNAFVLAGAAWNRTGTPEAALVLTERELPLAHGFRSDENSGLGLSLALCRDCPDNGGLDEGKLKALGFDPEGFRTQEDDRRKWPLPRRAWAVLEYEGPAWQAALQRRRQELEALRAQPGPDPREVEAAEKRLRRMEARDSRLVAVDAGTDPEALRRRYSDRSRYLITRAQIRMQRCWGAACGGAVSGRIARILPDIIHVPVQHHRALAEAFGGDRLRWNRALYFREAVTGPRYRVRLNYGARYEPWLVALESIGSPADGSRGRSDL